LNRVRESELHSREASFLTSVGPVGVPYLLWQSGERIQSPLDWREGAKICERQKRAWNLLSEPYHNVVNSSAKEKSRILDNMCLCKERPTRRNYIYGGVGSLDPHDEVGFKVALSQCLKLRKSRQ